MEKQPQLWPDLTVDKQAWELAKTALGPGASLHDVIQKAQELKEALRK
jgi:hypothetical protein